MKVLDSPIIDLGLLRLALCFALLMIVAVILRWWRSPNERDIYIAGFRMTVQLFLATFLLTFLFNMNKAGWSLLAVTVMWQVASIVALRPLRKQWKKLYFCSAFSLAIGGGVTLWVISAWVVGFDPWYNPRYFLPLAGMVFANGMNGVSLAADRVASEMGHRSEEIRQEMAKGKAAWEVALPSLQKSYHAALLPTINSMLVIGVVAFPGMMTGQILSGTAPVIAVKYQLMVMCMLLSSIGISTPIFLRLTYRHFLPHS